MRLLRILKQMFLIVVNLPQEANGSEQHKGFLERCSFPQLTDGFVSCCGFTAVLYSLKCQKATPCPRFLSFPFKAWLLQSAKDLPCTSIQRSSEGLSWFQSSFLGGRSPLVQVHHSYAISPSSQPCFPYSSIVIPESTLL